MMNTFAEYIFIIDRSGSMSGARMEKAKNALIFFLKSLPPNCTFNILSFGSSYQAMYKTPQGSSMITQAINNVSKFAANLGGTEILGPLNQSFAMARTSNMQRNIFLLTDGSVGNVD